MEFCEQQDNAHRWAANVHLDPWYAQEIAAAISNLAKIRLPELRWEEPGNLGVAEAATIRNPRTGEMTIVFEGWGTTLLTLVHEMVHCIRDWDDEHHDEVDWDLATLLLEVHRNIDV